jgi:hypothetical protein
MKKGMIVVVTVLTIGACSSDSNDPDTETYVTNLTGAAERPNPVTTTATGTGSLTVNANRTITYSLSATGMTPTVQHIHGPADAETAAPVIVPVQLGNNLTITPTSQFQGAYTYDSLVVLLRNNRTYFNVHSATFPGGEIRGNLRRP